MAFEFPIELDFRNVDFRGGRRTEEPWKKPSAPGQEPTTNSIHLRHDIQDLNAGHINYFVRRKHSHHCAIPALP